MSLERGVAVIGSANLDLVVSLERFPDAGETVMGERLEEVAGGKGLNQAIAAARGGDCAFIGSVGEDEAGRLLLEQLERAGVDATQVVHRPEPTGRAYIEVTPDGENRIVVMALANQRLEAAAVHRGLDALRPAVVLAQLEVPLEAVETAAEWASEHGARFVLNASPVSELSTSLLERCDPLIVNSGEAGALVHDGFSPGRDADVVELARRLVQRVASVAVTDGPCGCHVGTSERGISPVAGRPVTAVDTTGAGDVFAGTLAAALARGQKLEDAAERANEAAARIVQVPRSDR